MTSTRTSATPETTDGGVVDRFLADIATGTGISPRHFTADAGLDATVPGWRFRVRGAQAVAAEYSRWFKDPAVFESLHRWTVPGGEIIRYELAWTESGVPHAAHHCHHLAFGPDGRIATDTVFCGGRWDASLLAQMEEASR